MATSPVTPDAVVITIIYTALLAWGAWVGVWQIYQGWRRPEQLLNPLFRNHGALIIFSIHILVVSLDLIVCGPLSVAYKSPLWYWGGRVALVIASLPLAAYFNRNTESYGAIIGYWVRFRNLCEICLHIVVAAAKVDWFYYYGLLWWLVAYRYLDVGPRRLLQTLYSTPEKLAARPWAPLLTLAVIVVLYVLAFVAVLYGKIIYAAPPPTDLPEHEPAIYEGVIVVGANVGLALLEWELVSKYTGVGPAGRFLALADGGPDKAAGGATAPAGSGATWGAQVHPAAAADK